MSKMYRSVNKKDVAVIERLLKVGDDVESIAKLFKCDPSAIISHPQLKALTKLKKHSNPKKNQSKQVKSEKVVRHDPIKFKINEKGTSTILSCSDDEEFATSLADTTGVNSIDGAFHLMGNLLSSLPYTSEALGENAINQLTAYLHQLAPRDAVEGLVCSQMLVVSQWIQFCSQAAIKSELEPQHKARYRKDMLKMLNLSLKQVETLDKHRNKGQQTVTVQHVTVNDGGQAVVGKFDKADK